MSEQGGIASADVEAPEENNDLAGVASSAVEDAPASGEIVDAGNQTAEWTMDAPADFPIPQENLDSFVATAKELGLGKEAAAGMLAWHKKHHEAVIQHQAEQESQTLAGWKQEIEADDEFGKGHWKETVALAGRVFKTFDPTGELKQLLIDSRFEHHPAVIRAVARIGKAMAEDSIVKTGGGAQPAQAPWDRYYQD